jgi:LAO/AO transport system kinase
VPVLKTSAVAEEGLPALWAAIEACGAKRLAEGVEPRRRRRARYLIARAAADLVAQRIRDGAGDTLDTLADDVLAGRLLPADAAKAILK